MVSNSSYSSKMSYTTCFEVITSSSGVNIKFCSCLGCENFNNLNLNQNKISDWLQISPTACNNDLLQNIRFIGM